MDIIDCLNEEQSEIRRSTIDGRINRIFKYAFKPNMLEEKHIFKLPLKSGSDLIISEQFRRVVVESNLRGLLFNPI